MAKHQVFLLVLLLGIVARGLSSDCIQPFGCSYGIVNTGFGSCDVCAKGRGEFCGGFPSKYGTCADGLKCDRTSDALDDEPGYCIINSADPPCVFPFIFRDVSYSKCTTVGHPAGKRWCKTEQGYSKPCIDKKTKQREDCLFWAERGACQSKRKAMASCRKSCKQWSPSSTHYYGPYPLIWSEHQCRRIAPVKNLSFQECSSRCDVTTGCNVINFMAATNECTLRECPLPVPDPERNSSGWTGYKQT